MVTIPREMIVDKVAPNAVGETLNGSLGRLGKYSDAASSEKGC